MTKTFVPALSVQIAKSQVPTYTSAARCQPYTDWQTFGRIKCSSYCASFHSYCIVNAGFDLDADEHVWGKRGEWSTGAWQRWAKDHGLWRPVSTPPRAGWGVTFNFGEPHQHMGMVLVDQGSKLATVEGNTNGGAVLFRSRYKTNAEGYIAWDEAGQNATGAVAPTPKEVVQMGVKLTCVVPGSHPQKGPGAWKGRYPQVAVNRAADGTWEMWGMYGAKLEAQNKSAFGISIDTLGRLAGSITQLQPEWRGDGTWTGRIIGTATDFGVFHAVPHVTYT